MLNHLYMKIEDMEIAAGEVVTQTASQCFDISLWQFTAPLLVGGAVRIIDTDTQLDVDAFLDEITDGAVAVVQIVPSYLEVLLTHLEHHPRPLGGLRTISVTGEALKYELVQRWFAAHPGVKLVNAYGATEVSDDTMHEVLDGLPDRDFVTVGRSLRNVNTYILDENLALVPLGSPGEIAFSGVCVGRGYINDEERTRQAFVADPFEYGTRMYRTGDFGRWLPEGRIEYLGRRDEQVKIRGFRIEIGEIENKLLSMPGVHEAAVVIDGGAGDLRNLVAFFAGRGPPGLPRPGLPRHPAPRLHGAHLLPPDGTPAAHRERQDRQEVPRPARRDPRPRRRPVHRPRHPRRAAPRHALGRGPRRSPRTHRALRQLLRPRRHLPRRRTAPRPPRPGPVPQGPRRQARPLRPGRGPRRARPRRRRPGGHRPPPAAVRRPRPPPHPRLLPLHAAATRSTTAPSPPNWNGTASPSRPSNSPATTSAAPRRRCRTSPSSPGGSRTRSSNA